MVRSDDEVRSISHEVFGHKYLLEVAAAIAGYSDKRFHVQLLCRQLGGLNVSLLRPAVQHLKAANLVKELPAEGQTRPLEAAESVFWELCREFLAELGWTSVTDPGR